MHWSRYNVLFQSEKFGYFLYNTLSNTLIELAQSHYRVLEGLQKNETSSSINDSNFFALLQNKKVLLNNDDETRLILAQQYQRQAICFDTSKLGLTICPTLGCNFRCSYCFEHSQKESNTITPETVERLIDFIKSYKSIRNLSIAWYGGEPLLAFDSICDITEKIKALDLNVEDAGMVTNGYLLNKEKIALLDDLKIKFIQITLDGHEDAHDKRRILAGGGPTFQRILANIDALMNSSYSGTCSIRVNIDKNNQNNFIYFREALLERYEGKKLSVYAGRVDINIDHAYDKSRCLNRQEWVDFTFDMHHRGSRAPTVGFYPSGHLESICVATTHYGFVVGPEGELYKCWEDVGRHEMVIGNIHEDEPITNLELQAMYSIGIDAYNDPDCQQCNVLPICGGGCANKRLRSKFGKEKIEFCSPYKKNLLIFLETYIDAFRSQEICASVLNQGHKKMNHLGYRLISP